MKRRSVTFTDSPPEVIDNSNDCYNICAPTSNIFLWLQLAKIEERQRRYISDTQRQSQGHHCFRSLPDLNKQQHYLSVESKSSKSAFISNRGRNVFQQREQMDPVYLSISDLGMVVRPRPLLRAAIESVRNVTKMDTSWDLHGLCREGREKKLLQRRYAVSDYFLGRHRSALVTADAATQSPVKNALYRATELPVKENVDHGVINSNDKDDSIYSNDDTVSSKEIVLECKSSANDYNKNSASTGASNSSVHHRCTGDNRNDNDDYTFGVNYNVVNVIKCDGRVSESNSDCGKLAEQFLQRYHCHHLNDYKKSDSVAKTSRNWSWKNIGDENVISRRCYSLLNKPLQKKNYRRHHSSDARNTSFVFASTISNNSSMRDIISKHQWYYYPSMIYSKTQQQLVDEMAKHIAECLEQFNTGLDKVLQARQLLETSQELPADDRDTMLRLLNQAMRTSLKRMECNDDRYDPDGRHSESPNSLPGQRQCAPAQQLCGTNDGNANFHNIGSSMDPAEFFQQHGQQLLALLQQNMAKQN